MYVNLETNCIDFSVFVGTSNDVSKWTILITQWTVDFNNLAPEGCLQWYFGNMTGVVRSFNFDGGLHLASQDQNICVR